MSLGVMTLLILVAETMPLFVKLFGSSLVSEMASSAGRSSSRSVGMVLECCDSLRLGDRWGEVEAMAVALGIGMSMRLKRGEWVLPPLLPS